ncbi:hypothetical protein JCM33374_g5015 [Metschnikowia sp. JCM 33374]|nr:hypothetical protein JCM33374_g5015 [Metschnikowia sp. JCM 33374]
MNSSARDSKYDISGSPLSTSTVRRTDSPEVRKITVQENGLGIGSHKRFRIERKQEVIHSSGDGDVEDETRVKPEPNEGNVASEDNQEYKENEESEESMETCAIHIKIEETEGGALEPRMDIKTKSPASPTYENAHAFDNMYSHALPAEDYSAGSEYDADASGNSDHESTTHPKKNIECKRKDRQEEQEPKTDLLIPSLQKTNGKACPVCSRWFEQRAAQISHTKTHFRTRSHRCDVCQKVMASNRNLQNHKKIHTRKNLFSCPVCDISYVSRYSLDVHLRNRKCEASHECTVCQKKFISEKKLGNHKPVHSVTFEGTVCQIKFTSKQNIKNHMLTHTGEKPFECPECGQKFFGKPQLTNHIRRHTVEKKKKKKNTRVRASW